MKEIGLLTNFLVKENYIINIKRFLMDKLMGKTLKY